MTPSDRHARKQVLLTRIAFERNELRRELVSLRHASEPRQLLRAAIGKRFSGPLGRRLFGGSRRDENSPDPIVQALAWFKRYRGAAALVGGLLPVLRGRGGWKRILRIAAIAGATWIGWRATRRQR